MLPESVLNTADTMFDSEPGGVEREPTPNGSAERALAKPIYEQFLGRVKKITWRHHQSSSEA